MRNRHVLSRRHVLQAMGITIALPMLEAMTPFNRAYAQAAGRKRFIGVFAPNGAYMPGCVNGNFTWEDALSPLNGTLRNNAMIIRGLSKVSPPDLHWNNTASFLSAKTIEVPSPNHTVAGKTLDQILADQANKPIRSIQVGWKDEVWIGTDHDTYSNKYLNCISWRRDNEPISKTTRPIDLFNQIFAANSSSRKHIEYMIAKRKSVLDVVMSQAKSLQSRVPSGDKQKLEQYFETVRSIEQDLNKSKPTCDITVPQPPLSAAYMEHFRLFHRMIAVAMKCDLTSAATVQFDTGVGDTELVEPSIGYIHHDCTHHGGDNNKVEALRKITRRHVELYADLLQKLKDEGVLNETLVLFSSNMADGNSHLENNLPTILGGGGTDLRFGEEVFNQNDRRPFANLLVEVAQQVGLSSITQMGNNQNTSTGALAGIRK